MSERLLNIVILIIVVVWALNITVPIFVKDYEPIPELNSAFLVLVGLVISGKGNGQGDPPDNPEPRRAVQNGDADPPE